jgi:UDP-N-acetylenolpyruvoylglucosamine reductase
MNGQGREPEDPAMAMPAGVRANFPLARLTTVRTGGPAEWFGRAGGEAQLLELLGWAREGGLPVAVVGSGSNLLVADDGARGLVVKLDGDLARIEVEESRILCGGGARLPAVAARAARVGLSGIEWGVNIPGTVGGSVRMNANAYGGRLEDVLSWVGVASADGIERRSPVELGFAYRSSSLGDGEIVTEACFELAHGDVETVKEALVDMRARRHEAQPQGIKTFGSTFKNPEGSLEGPLQGSLESALKGSRDGSHDGSHDGSRADGLTAGKLLSRAGCNGLTVGGARFAPKHANFIENTGRATTADVIAVMAEGRRRVEEKFGVTLEPEVQTLGDVRFPW